MVRTLAVLALCCCVALGDHYATLGVRRDSSAAEIKKAYKKMAIQYHPDKNPDPSAQEMFVQVSEAYQVLSDKTKKQNYDRYGTADAPATHRHQRQGGGHYSFFNQRSSHTPIFSKESLKITRRNLEHFLSDPRDLWLVEFYADWCSQCRESVGTWDAFGASNRGAVRLGRINTDEDNWLARNRFGVRNLPSVIAVFQGEVTHMRGTMSARRLSDFAHKVIPNHVTHLSSQARYDTWLGADPDRVSVVILARTATPSLTWKALAVRLHMDIRFGLVIFNSALGQKLAHQYGISRSSAFLVFRGSSPQVYDGDMERSAVEAYLESNRFPILAKLTGRTMSPLCGGVVRRPAGKHNRPCVIFLSTAGRPDNLANMFADIAGEHLGSEVQFAWADAREHVKFAEFFQRGKEREPLVFMDDAAQEYSVFTGKPLRDDVVVWIEDSLKRDGIQFRRLAGVPTLVTTGWIAFIRAWVSTIVSTAWAGISSAGVLAMMFLFFSSNVRFVG